jgi:CubicO group peptidase (beta-lactamase class C family)
MSMKKAIVSIFYHAAIASVASAQSYFPPLAGNAWETVSHSELNWCPDAVDSLLAFAEARNSKALLILVNGRMALEAYMNGHSQSGVWYWASAGKTLAALYTGMVQQDGLLHINDPISQYLGEGWTTCPPAEEATRTIWHQLTMTSSFNNDQALWDCTSPSCFQCIGAVAGSEWHYHNGVYRRLHDVLSEATGMSMLLYHFTRLQPRTGITGLWSDNQLFISNARSMARFGLLALNGFVWNGDSILTDTQYALAQVTPSQSINPAYGYLWWLNGSGYHYRPGIHFPLPGPIIPTAPPDLYAGLGANDQKVYVVPSLHMVVVRMGEAAYGNQPTLTNFDSELWSYIMQLDCTLGTQSAYHSAPTLHLYPNPAAGAVRIARAHLYREARITDLLGRTVATLTAEALTQPIALPGGWYMVHATTHTGQVRTARVVVQ